MTFEEWWNNFTSKITAERKLKPFDFDNVKEFADFSWQAAQPKWTYCKDGMPTEDGNYLVAVLLPYGHRTVLSSDYYANNCDFWEIDPDREIIAWMPLPEAPNVHDD